MGEYVRCVWSPPFRRRRLRDQTSWTAASRRIVPIAAAAACILGARVAVAAGVVPVDDFLSSPAVKSFREGRYADASEEFEALRSQHPDDPNVLLNLASSLRRANRLVVAKQVLLHAADVAPDAAEIYYYLGLTNYKLDDLEAAEAAWRKTVELAPDTTEGQVAQQALDELALKRNQQAVVEPDRPWNAYAQIGGEYDSNVTAGKGGERDAAFRLPLYLQGDYRLFREGGFSLLAGAWGYHANNFGDNADNFDLNAVAPSLRATYAFRIGDVAAEAGLGYEYERDWLQDDYFGQRHEIRPSVSITWDDPRLQTVAYYAARFETFSEKGDVSSITSRNAVTNVEGVRQFVFSDNHQHYLTAAAEFRQSGAHGANFNYDSYAGELGVSLALPLALRLDLTGRYEYERHPDFQADEKLKIDRQVYSVGLSRRFTDQLTASLLYWYRNDDATVGAFAYDRSVAGFYLGYKL